MKLSICILCYNYGRFVGRAIESALLQEVDGFPLEVIVIDDGSEDDTLEVCRKYSGDITIISEGNQGFGASLSRAITRSSGDYVLFLDADDYFLPGKIEAFTPWFRQGVLFVHDRCYFINEDGEMISNRLHGGGSTSTIAVRRDAALSLVPVENEISFHALLRLGHGVVLDRAFTSYRFHNQSMTNRNIAGKQNTYLAQVTHNLARRLASLLDGTRPDWMEDEQLARKVIADFRAQAFYNEFEAALELRKPIGAWRAYFKMMLNAWQGFGVLKRIYLIRTAQAILMRPAIRGKVRC